MGAAQIDSRPGRQGLALQTGSRQLDIKDLTIQKVKEASSWLRDYVTAIKNKQYHPFTPLERLTREATRDQPWGPTGTLLKELAEQSTDDSSCRIILAVLQARMACPPLKWRNIYKALTVLEYLLKNGSELCVQITRAEIVSKLEDLQSFEYVSVDGRDQGVNVRLRAQAIRELLRDEERLVNERAVLSQRQRRYQGFARDQIAPERTLSEAPMAYGAISPNDAPALRRTRSAGESEASFAVNDGGASPRANGLSQAAPRGRPGETKGVTMEENKKHLAALRQLLARPENRACADCMSSSAGGRPTWASINTGAFICMRCAGIHRGLGTHVSKVRSCTLDTWLPEQVAFMSATGNAVANVYREAKLDPAQRPGPDSPDLAAFIRRKYNGEYAEGAWPPISALQPLPASSPAPIRTSSRVSTAGSQPYEARAARMSGDNAIEAFCHNASQLEAALRSSGAPVRRMSFDAGDQFSVNASFTTSVATPAAHRTRPSVSESLRGSDTPVHPHPCQHAPAPVPEMPDLMAFDDSPHAPRAGSPPPHDMHSQQALIVHPLANGGMHLAPIQELELGLHLLDDDLFGADVAHASYMQPTAAPWLAPRPSRQDAPSHTAAASPPQQPALLSQALSFEDEPAPAWHAPPAGPPASRSTAIASSWQPHYHVTSLPTQPVPDSAAAHQQQQQQSSTAHPAAPASQPAWSLPSHSALPGASHAGQGLHALVQAALKDMAMPVMQDSSLLRQGLAPRPSSLTELRAQSSKKDGTGKGLRQVQVHAVSNGASMNGVA